MHHRNRPKTGHEKLDWIRTSLTDSKHKQESVAIHSVIASSRPSGGMLWLSGRENKNMLSYISKVMLHKVNFLFLYPQFEKLVAIDV
jgi:hypothetical protein